MARRDQPAWLQPEDQPDLIQGDLGEQAWKPGRPPIDRKTFDESRYNAGARIP
jgi:hypothetical protein